MKSLLAAVALAGAAFFATSHAYAIGPSFDCGRAYHPDELMICANQRLAVADIMTSTAFYQAKRNNRRATLSLTRDFLRRRAACGYSVACIYQEQVGIMILYRALGATVLDY